MISWYQKFVLIFWYQKFVLIFWYQKFVLIFWYQKLIFWYHKMIFGYQKLKSYLAFHSHHMSGVAQCNRNLWNTTGFHQRLKALQLTILTKVNNTVPELKSTTTALKFHNTLNLLDQINIFNNLILWWSQVFLISYQEKITIGCGQYKFTCPTKYGRINAIWILILHDLALIRVKKSIVR